MDEIFGHGIRYSLSPAEACRPGPHRGHPRLTPRKVTPLTFRQHIPNVSEKTIGASGPSEGKIIRDAKRFREGLITNLNPDIVFKDEEQTNADRMMTERCKDRLNRLAMMVSEYWKNQVKLRVTEAWDEDGSHEKDSLHYEGRAVDITTTDRDRSKYGILARLAVEAGFDWVFYESRGHVHCSVKADKSDAAIYGGCFSGESTVALTNGVEVQLSSILPGDEVLSVDENGNVLPDRILTFMDRRTLDYAPISFREIKTETGKKITMTATHLIKVISAQEVNPVDPNNVSRYATSHSQFVHAKSVRVGDYVLRALTNSTSSTQHADVKIDRVASTKDVFLRSGAFAPLTKRGTIIVNGLVTSCYAVIERHDVAHIAMTPLRYYHLSRAWFEKLEDQDLMEGVTFYPWLLYYIGSFFLSKASLLL